MEDRMSELKPGYERFLLLKYFKVSYICLFTELVLEVVRGAEIIISYFAAAKDAAEKVSHENIGTVGIPDKILK